MAVYGGVGSFRPDNNTIKINGAGEAYVYVTGQVTSSNGVSIPSSNTAQGYSEAVAGLGASPVMMGLGHSSVLSSPLVLTPNSSGNVRVEIMVSEGGNTGMSLELSYGSTAAPANGASVTGTQTGGAIGCSGSASIIPNLSFSYVIPNLTLGTAYWFDLYGTTGTSNLEVIASVSEIK